MKVAILAISRKLNGYCVAGKEIRPDGTFGAWIRPVTHHRENNVIWTNDMTYVDGSLPQLLDIAENSIWRRGKPPGQSTRRKTGGAPANRNGHV